MKAFRRFAFFSTLATYFVIFMGGLVRISGAGLGCPDWPKCFGRWIPPISVSQLPQDIDPSLFNFTLAWIEYINRLSGILLGLLILVTAVLAIRYYSRVMAIVLPSLAAAILVAYQGWQGGQVVASSLNPQYVSLHLAVAVIIASLMTYVTQQAYYKENPAEEKGASYPRGISAWVGLLWLLVLVQIILGTQVRSGLEIYGSNHPLAPQSTALGNTGSIIYIHMFLGIVIAIGVWQVGIRILKSSDKPSVLVKQGSGAVIVLALGQVATGAILVFFGVPNVMRIFHLWVASLFFGFLLLVYSAFREYGRIL